LSIQQMQIISGGQTGADRAALDFAVAQVIPHGGWCPRGRRAEDGRINRRYRLRQTPSREHSQRTEWNIRDSDATLIISVARGLSGGSLLTRQIARRLGKPCLHLGGANITTLKLARLNAFLVRHKIIVLNVAGPRASDEPGVYDLVMKYLTAIETTLRN
jgi:hypothetical protein